MDFQVVLDLPNTMTPQKLNCMPPKKNDLKRVKLGKIGQVYDNRKQTDTNDCQKCVKKVD